jgi:hypothetical protein
MAERWRRREDGTVEVPDNYQCPLCPCAHPGKPFFPSQTVGAPICQGCTIDLSHYLERDDRAQDPLLDALERVTGLSFPECRRKYYREIIDLFRQKLAPERQEQEVAFEAAHTGRSREQIVAHWKDVLAGYETDLQRLQSDLG